MKQEKITALVIKAQEGDNKALNKLFNEFYNEVYYFALKTVKNEDVAYDVTQEVFVEVIKTLPSLREPEAFKSWLYKVAYHQCTRYFRKKKDVLVEEDEDGNTIFDDLEDKSAEFVPDKALEQKEFRETIVSMINELSEEQRSAVMLYYFDELSIKEIAKVQCVSEGTVKSRLNYGRKAVKKSIEQYERENGIKLHAIPFFPFIKWIFAEEAGKTMAIGSAKVLAESVAATTGASLNIATGIGAQIAGLPLVTKIVSCIVATTLVAGTATGVWYANRDTVPVSNETTTTTTVPSIDESTTIESTTLATEESSTQEIETTTKLNKELTTKKSETTTKVETTTQEASILSDEVAFAEVAKIAESQGWQEEHSFLLPYFNNTSELTAVEAGMYVFGKIDTSNYEIFEIPYDPDTWEGYDTYMYIPYSQFVTWSQRCFGRTYNFKEMDGKCYYSFGVPQERFTYDEEKNAFKVELPANGAADAFITKPECTSVTKVGPNTYKAIAEYEGVVEETTLTYVNGYWRFDSHKLVK